MKYLLLRSFIKKFYSYKTEDQRIIIDAVEKIKNYFETNTAPYGLRIKRLSKKIFEGRINIHLRVMYFREKDVVKFFCHRKSW